MSNKDLFRHYVKERHGIWEQRQLGLPQPWTDDPVLASRKFTNVFRILDPGSQFVLTDLWDEECTARDTLARLFLYRYTNRIETWRHLRATLGRYPKEDDLDEGLIEVLHRWRDWGENVFSGAYVILPNPGHAGDKVEQAVERTHLFMRTKADDFLAAESQQERFDIMTSLQGVGNFMAMQILTDWGYTPYGGGDGDMENAFVVPGPGAIKGSRALDLEAPKAIIWAFEELHDLVSIDVGGSFFRYPSLMDWQNCFCEFSKYVRYRDAGKVGNPYRPGNPGIQPEPVFPEHWKL